MNKLNRRHFLKLSGAAGAAAVMGPTILTPRFANATDAFGQAKHVLVLFAKGGMRSHATFNAVGTFQHNPWGTQESTADWTLGGAIRSRALTTSLGRVPGFHEMASDVAVLACVDHEPDGIPDVGHDTGVARICGGEPTARTGLLSRVGAHHALYEGGFSAAALPPVEIGQTDFGLGAGDYGARRPLTLRGAGASFSSDFQIGQGWKTDARARLDARFARLRSTAFKRRIANFQTAKQNTALFAGILQDDRLRVREVPDATDAGVTNAQLLEALGDYTLDEDGDLQPVQSWGADVALALRFFAMGAPMCVVTRDIYDLHDDERDNYEPRASDLCRQLAALNFLLKAMPHPEGGTYWDKTVVVTLSEFSRNNTFAETGFNSGNGSDHVLEESGPTRNQAIAAMGGVITAGGRLIGSTDEEMNATGVRFSSRQLLSTLLDVIGLDHSEFWPDAPINELFS
jgi:hypothetical protein